MGNQQVLKRVNLLRVLLALKTDLPLTKNQLCTQLQLSRPTVDRAISDLLVRGVIQNDGQSLSGGGRRAVLYSFNGQGGYTIGVDLELPELNLVLVDLSGCLVTSRSLEIPPNSIAPQAAMKFISDRVMEMVIEEGVEIDRIIGVGLGIPAFLHADKITIAGRNLPEWSEVPVKEILERLLTIPVWVDNDVNFMALAEDYTIGYHDSVLAYIALRKGLAGDIRMGGSVLVDGVLFRGASGNAVSLQHAYVEANKLKKLRRRKLDPTATTCELTSLVIDHLVAPIMHIVTLFDPLRLVINAEILEDGEDIFISECARRINHNLSEFDWKIMINKAQEREFSCAKGGALFVLQRLFNDPHRLLAELTASPS